MNRDPDGKLARDREALEAHKAQREADRAACRLKKSAHEVREVVEDRRAELAELAELVTEEPALEPEETEDLTPVYEPEGDDEE